MEPKGLLPISKKPATRPLSWVRWIQFTSSHHISWRSILILFSIYA